MARLPKPGGDAGNWGEVLNEFLRQEHNDDGTFKDVARPLDLTKENVGLGNVANLAPADLPVSSATQEALNDKLEYSLLPVLNVRDSRFGAIGDGVTDDRPAIQSALDAVGSAGGGAVYLPEGTYALATREQKGLFWAALWVPDNVRIYGAGMGVTILLADAALPEGTKTVQGVQGVNVEISHLTIDGNADGRAGVDTDEDEGISFVDAPGPVHIHHVEVMDTGQEAIDCDDSAYITVEHCYLHDCWGNGIHFAGVGGTSDSVLRNLTVDNCAHGRGASALFHAAGIHVAGPRNRIESCRVSNSHEGIRCSTNAADTVIIGAVLTDNANEAIMMTGGCERSEVISTQASASGLGGGTLVTIGAPDAQLIGGTFRKTDAGGSVVSFGATATRTKAVGVTAIGGNNGIRLSGVGQSAIACYATGQGFNGITLGLGADCVVQGCAVDVPSGGGSRALNMQDAGGSALITGCILHGSVSIRNDNTVFSGNRRTDGNISIVDGSPTVIEQTGGGQVMYSLNGTAYHISVSDSGTMDVISV